MELKNQAWRHITYALFKSTNTFIIEKVKNKWKNLRDTFVKAQRKKDKPNAKPWKLENEMNFLIPHINPKFTHITNGEGNHSPVERYLTPSPEQFSKESLLENLLVKKEEEEEEYNGRYVDDGMVMQHVETVMEDSPRTVKKKRRKDTYASNPSQHFLDTSDQSVRFEQVQSQYDAIDCYFLGLAQTVKRLKPINQVLLKKAISNLVFDAELKETEAVCEATSSS